jgi:hypothetical protein
MRRGTQVDITLVVVAMAVGVLGWMMWKALPQPPASP